MTESDVALLVVALLVQGWAGARVIAARRAFRAVLSRLNAAALFVNMSAALAAVADVGNGDPRGVDLARHHPHKRPSALVRRAIDRRKRVS